MNIKAIIFDYGEVLSALEDPAADVAHRAKIAQRLNMDPDEVWSYLFEGETAIKWMSGQITRDEFWSEVLAPRGITDPDEVAAFDSFVFAARTHVNHEMGSLVQELYGRYKLAVLSNTDWSEENMRSRLYNDFELPAGLFDVIVTSSSAGVPKPDPAIYQLVLDRLGIQPEEAVFTDDLPNFTAAAAKLGIHTHTFTTPAAFRVYLQQIGVL